MLISLIIVIAALVALLALFSKLRELKSWTLSQQKQIDELKKKVAMLSEQSVVGKEDKCFDKEDLSEKDDVMSDFASIEDMPPVPLPQIPPVPPEIKVVSAAKNQDGLEEKIGVNLLSKIGIMVLIIGVGFFVKYAIDNNWINEVCRTVLGLCAGFVLWGIGIRLRDTYRNFSSVLNGGGFAINFVTIAIAYNYYHLFPSWLAFGVLVSLTVIMAAVSIKWNRRELASVAVAGGFIAPFLASSDTGSFVALCFYMLILNAGMAVIALRKNWVEIPLASMVLTYVIVPVAVHGAMKTDVSLSASLFVTIYYLMYLPVLTALQKRSAETRLLKAVLVCALLVTNFAYFVEALSFFGDHLFLCRIEGVVPLIIAAANCLAYALMLHKGDNRALGELVIGAACVAVLLFAPIQFSDTSVVIICLSVAMPALFKSYALFRMESFAVVGVVLGYVLGVTLFIGWCFDLLSPELTWGIWRYMVAGVCYIVSAFVIESFATVSPVSRREAWRIKRVNYGFVSAFWFGVLAISGGVYLLLYSTLHWTLAFRGIVAFIMLEMLLIKPVRGNGAGGGGLFAGAGVLLYGLQLGYFSDGITLATLTAVNTVLIASIVWCQFFAGGKLVDSGCVMGRDSRMLRVVYANICVASAVVSATLLWLQIFGGEKWCSMGFSVSIILVAAGQMFIGMRGHDKITRVMSLVSFAIVLVKLAVNDMWAMPSMSRIVVFILLGVILLLVSFLYQRLKNALFGDGDSAGSESE